jgi:hypothetical protein
MATQTQPALMSPVVAIIFGLAALGLVIAVLAGIKLPLLASDRAVLVALIVVGMGLCTYGIGRSQTLFGWANPITILGVILGVVILAIFVSRLAGWSLPLITSDRAAILTIGAIGVGKVLLQALQGLVFKAGG